MALFACGDCTLTAAKRQEQERFDSHRPLHAAPIDLRRGERSRELREVRRQDGTYRGGKLGGCKSAVRRTAGILTGRGVDGCAGDACEGRMNSPVVSG